MVRFDDGVFDNQLSDDATVYNHSRAGRHSDNTRQSTVKLRYDCEDLCGL